MSFDFLDLIHTYPLHLKSIWLTFTINLNYCDLLRYDLTSCCDSETLDSRSVDLYSDLARKPCSRFDSRVMSVVL